MYRTIATILLFAVTIGGARSDELSEREWIEVTSNNFRVHSVLTEERTIELLRHLEVMRAALGDTDGEPTYQTAVPTVIIAVDSESDYRTIGAPEGTVGVFVADQRENAIIVQDSQRVRGIQTILHEYVHYLHRQNGRGALP